MCIRDRDGPGWSSGASPKEPVLLTVELTGKFHVRKMVIRWTYGGPSQFQVLFSESGDDDSWVAYPIEASRFPVQSIIFTKDFYGHSTGYIRIELAGLNHPKYFGVEELQILGDLDLIWRAQAVAAYDEATASLESPKSSVGRAHKAANRPIASPVVPAPKHTPSSFSGHAEAPAGVDNVTKAALASKDAEIAALRDENARLKAEAFKLKSKLRDAKTIIDSIV
eukprot:TRINITY_DN17350_c0_g1_i1.p1 TRINITY_DN17350_c0_g1~~TRINITY_DN17350_c0_g1_i1.p1  ORF type:complete len:224 (+),score=43.53 TRINITY_DN17350_c0_g1_i1:105-776(+)